MKFALDGSKSLSDQTLILRNAEAAGSKVLSLYPELDHHPENTAVLDDLGPNDPEPSEITLIAGPVPPGKKIVWLGVIYVAGILTACLAYR